MVEQAHGSTVTVEQVGVVALASAQVDAVAITLMLAASPRETVYASSPAAADLEELTTTLGEGPGVDALAGGPALVGDLSDPHAMARWPAFGPAVLDRGIRAAFALPLQVGGIRLGVLDLYRSRAGALEPDQLADALLLADTACALLLDATSSHNGHGPEPAGLQDPRVHQATGMIIAQLEVSAAVALVRLRAHAYANDAHLGDVAADVVARRLRFHPDSDNGESC
jgi:hypothetical protein